MQFYKPFNKSNNGYVTINHVLCKQIIRQSIASIWGVHPVGKVVKTLASKVLRLSAPSLEFSQFRRRQLSAGTPNFRPINFASRRE